MLWTILYDVSPPVVELEAREGKAWKSLCVWFLILNDFFSVQRTRILESFKQFKSMAMYWAIIKPNQNTINSGLSF